MAISLSDFNNLSEKEKKKALQDLKKEIGVSGIVKEWDISRSKAYSMLNELNIPLKPKRIRTSNEKDVSFEAGKNQSIKGQDDQSIPISQESNDKNKNVITKRSRKTIAPKSSLEFETDEDISSFSLHLETQGSASLISETLQMLLGAEKLAGSNIQVNITVQKV